MFAFVIFNNTLRYIFEQCTINTFALHLNYGSVSVDIDKKRANTRTYGSVQAYTFAPLPSMWQVSQPLNSVSRHHVLESDGKKLTHAERYACETNECSVCVCVCLLCEQLSNINGISPLIICYSHQPVFDLMENHIQSTFYAFVLPRCALVRCALR